MVPEVNMLTLPPSPVGLGEQGSYLNDYVSSGVTWVCLHGRLSYSLRYQGRPSLNRIVFKE